MKKGTKEKQDLLYAMFSLGLIELHARTIIKQNGSQIDARFLKRRERYLDIDSNFNKLNNFNLKLTHDNFDRFTF